jgi:hypothetical protein
MASPSYSPSDVHLTSQPWSRVLTFSGLPDQRNLDGLLQRIEDIVVQRTVDRRAFRAIIECVQNLERHAAPGRPVRFHLSGRVCKGEPQFSIRSLNPIRQDDLEGVVDWIRHYSEMHRIASTSMNQDEINWRELYRKWLEQPSRSRRGGAGLGWISLARLAMKSPHIRIIHLKGEPNLYFSIEVAC